MTKHYVKGVFTQRRFPGIAVAFMFLMGPLVWASYSHWGVDSHMRNARKLFGEGNFQGAISEVSLYLEEEPEAIDGLDMLADAHNAMMQISRGNFDKYMMHRCKAIYVYKKRLDIRYNSNIGTKLAMLENQEMVSREGKYVRCEDGRAQGTETGFGREGSGEPW